MDPVRIVVVDPGEIETRAASFGPQLELIAHLSLESAAAPRPDRSLAAGREPLALAGDSALLAHSRTLEKLQALLASALFSLCEGGERLALALVADPGEKADRLAEIEELWDDESVALSGTDPALPGARLTKRVSLCVRTICAGEAFLDQAIALGFLGEGGDRARAVIALDLGHRATRLYVLDADSGVTDLEILPHGGQSFLAHARRFAAERAVAVDDARLLREIAAGGFALSLGGLTLPTRRLFELPREELEKALAAGIASRLRRIAESGGRIPSSLLLAPVAARALDGPRLARRLAERGFPLEQVATFPDDPPPLIGGGLTAALRYLAPSASGDARPCVR